MNSVTCLGFRSVVSAVLVYSSLAGATSDAWAMGKGSSTGGGQDSSSLPVPPAGSGTGPVQVVIRRLTGFDATETAKVKISAAIMQRVLSSEAFRQEVLNFTWNGERQFANNGGLSNEQIYQTIMNGSEDLNPGIDHTADLHLELYHGPSNVVGYTDPSTLSIFMNTSFFDTYFDVAEVAGNLSHEWMHKLGFDHDFRRTAQRPYSVPYAIGEIVVKMGEKFSGL